MIKAFFELNAHHFYDDDGIINEQAQCQNEGAKANLMQINAIFIHQYECRRHDDRNGEGHHDTGANAEGCKADEQYYGDGFE